jgi:hypothetical protein
MSPGPQRNPSEWGYGPARMDAMKPTAITEPMTPIMLYSFDNASIVSMNPKVEVYI